MTTRSSAIEFMTPADKLINWSIEYQEFIAKPRLLSLVRALDYFIPAYEECPVFLRKGVISVLGTARWHYNPNTKADVYHITMSRTWWKAYQTLCGEALFQMEWKATLAHEFAHVLTFTKRKPDFTGHGEVWYLLATIMGDNGARTCGKDTDRVHPSTNVTWGHVHAEARRLYEAGKQAKLDRQLADLVK